MKKSPLRLGLALLAGCLLAMTLAVPAAPAQTGYAPTSSYIRRSLAGWTVLVSRELAMQHQAEARRVEQHLARKLAEVARVLPARAVTRLRGVRIWLEWNDTRNPGGVYHSSRQWLLDYGFNPDMAEAVEFGNAANFLAWSQDHDQPMMVLHELAHAWHHKVLGYGHPEIEAAYRQALLSGKYDKVTRHVGPIGPAYALTDPQEYFAESTEAYFGTNDFYPYVRSELAQVDPTMFRLLGRLWQSR